MDLKVGLQRGKKGKRLKSRKGSCCFFAQAQARLSLTDESAEGPGRDARQSRLSLVAVGNADILYLATEHSAALYQFASLSRHEPN